MMQERCVIVGGGHAGAQLAASLRQGGWKDEIWLVSAEHALPYHRPPLSKSYLDGTKPREQLPIRPAAFYDKYQIDVRLGVRVDALDRHSRRLLGDGFEASYSHLALATGARVRRLNVPGADLPGVCYLRDVDDSDRIREAVREGGSAVVIGGGYLGLETAASLTRRGMNVTVIESEGRILPRIGAPQVSAFFTRAHRERGVTVVVGAAVRELVGGGRVESVELGDGTRVVADLVVVGIGVVPDTRLAEAAGLEVDDGVVVDEFARTSDTDIVAAGDCTRHSSVVYGASLRLESVQNATDQAKTAASTLCGKRRPHRAVPWFWSDQYELRLQSAGVALGFDQLVIRGDENAPDGFAVFYFREGRLLAVDAINRPKEFMAVRAALARGHSADPRRIADDSTEIQHAFHAVPG